MSGSNWKIRDTVCTQITLDYLQERKDYYKSLEEKGLLNGYKEIHLPHGILDKIIDARRVQHSFYEEISKDSIKKRAKTILRNEPHQWYVLLSKEEQALIPCRGSKVQVDDENLLLDDLCIPPSQTSCSDCRHHSNEVDKSASLVEDLDDECWVGNSRFVSPNRTAMADVEIGDDEIDDESTDTEYGRAEISWDDDETTPASTPESTTPRVLPTGIKLADPPPLKRKLIGPDLPLLYQQPLYLREILRGNAHPKDAKEALAFLNYALIKNPVW